MNPWLMLILLVVCVAFAWAWLTLWADIVAPSYRRWRDER